MTSILILSALLGSTVELPPPPSYKAERVGMYLAAAADIALTRDAIRKGAKEGNPLLTPLVGKTPSTLKLIGVKAVSIAVTELAARYHKKRGEHKMAKFLYWISTISWAYAAGWNIQWQFK